MFEFLFKNMSKFMIEKNETMNFTIIFTYIFIIADSLSKRKERMNFMGKFWKEWEMELIRRLMTMIE